MLVPIVTVEDVERCTQGVQQEIERLNQESIMSYC
jgi:hypothetical protein